MFREQAGKDAEIINSDLSTYGELYHWAATQYRFDLPKEMIQLAVDDEFTSFDQPLRDGARVVFIPPVAGG